MVIFAEICFVATRATLICIACLFVVGCGLFSTREPEPPTSSGRSFEPPTSPSIVIENFKNAVKDKNAENFSLCLSDTARGGRLAYQFEPTAEIAARYSSLFAAWNINSERQAFISIMSKIPADSPPSLLIANGRFDIATQDSVVYIGNYLLIANHAVAFVKTRGSGIIRLVIIPDASGLWSIARWTDAPSASPDSTSVSWSELKAQFSN